MTIQGLTGKDDDINLPEKGDSFVLPGTNPDSVYDIKELFQKYHLDEGDASLDDALEKILTDMVLDGSSHVSEKELRFLTEYVNEKLRDAPGSIKTRTATEISHREDGQQIRGLFGIIKSNIDKGTIVQTKYRRVSTLVDQDIEFDIGAFLAQEGEVRGVVDDSDRKCFEIYGKGSVFIPKKDLKQVYVEIGRGLVDKSNPYLYHFGQIPTKESMFFCDGSVINRWYEGFIRREVQRVSEPITEKQIKKLLLNPRHVFFVNGDIAEVCFDNANDESYLIRAKKGQKTEKFPVTYTKGGLLIEADPKTELVVNVYKK